MIRSGVLQASDVLNALAAHVAVLDASGAIVFVNAAWSRFARENGGVPGQEAYLGANYLAACQQAVRQGDPAACDAAAGLEALLRGDRDEFELEYPCHAPDRERWFRMSVTRFATDQSPYLVVSHEEITRQKQSEQALRSSERLLRSVLEALPIGVWIVDAGGRIVQGNAAGRAVWGGARYVGPQEYGEYKGWWVSTGEPIAAEDWAAARAILKGETSIDEEVEIECFDGQHKIILNSAVPLRDEEHRVAGAIIVNQDITSRKRTEVEREALLRERERLRQLALEANRAKDEFIATLSHELRTPLQSVIGWATVLRSVLKDPAQLERAAAAIERNARIQAQLLNDTLDMSRIASGKLSLEESDVEFGALVGQALDSMRPVAADNGIELVEDLSPVPAVVRGDPVRLQQIVWNLLSNALKFTPGNGRVEVRTEVSGGTVALTVRDTGVGIAPELMPFLFERFRQGENKPSRSDLGLGLGLAIVKELVERHHGTIEAESAGRGAGATFTVRFPVIERSRDEAPAQ